VPQDSVTARPLGDALAAAAAAPQALLALGIPLCPSCELLEASLTAVRDARPGLVVEIAALATAEEWAQREELLWPRGIHVSRASIPVLVVMRDGDVVATRQGGGPATVIDAWVAEWLGPASRPVDDGLSDAERSALSGIADLRARHLSARGRLSVD
jgi:hypothetical protein